MARRDWYCEDVLSGKLEIKMVWEDERVIAFHHPQPQAEIHVVVIPKQHVPSLWIHWRWTANCCPQWYGRVRKSPGKLGLDNTGFYVRANAAAPGVTPHMHWHIMGPGVP